MQKGASDPQLVALYFQFGRYLLMSCSLYSGCSRLTCRGYGVKTLKLHKFVYLINFNSSNSRNYSEEFKFVGIFFFHFPPGIEP
ncbi:MAG: hypothetical protein AB2L20_32560 [Mangrovibacterium sp.]